MSTPDTQRPDPAMQLPCIATASGNWRGFCVRCRRWHEHTPGAGWRVAHCGIGDGYFVHLDPGAARQRSNFTTWLRAADRLDGPSGDLVLRASFDPRWPIRRRTLAGFREALMNLPATPAEVKILDVAWRCWWAGHGSESLPEFLAAAR